MKKWNWKVIVPIVVVVAIIALVAWKAHDKKKKDEAKGKNPDGTPKVDATKDTKTSDKKNGLIATPYGAANYAQN